MGVVPSVAGRDQIGAGCRELCLCARDVEADAGSGLKL